MRALKKELAANKEKLMSLQERKANGNYNVGSSKGMTSMKLIEAITKRKEIIADVQRKIAALK